MQKGKIYIETNGTDLNGNKYAVPKEELNDFNYALDMIMYSDDAMQVRDWDDYFVEKFTKYKVIT
jgi:hypothetical protein